MTRSGYNDHHLAASDEEQRIRGLLLRRGPGHPEYSYLQTQLAIQLRKRYEMGDDLALLDEAVRAGAAAVTGMRPDDPLPGARYTTLALALFDRSSATGDLDDLHEAHRLALLALSGLPKDHSERPAALTNLGNMQWQRFKRLKVIGDIDEAVASHREAAKTTPKADLYWRATRLANLGVALLARYETTGRRTDINEAIACGRKAASLMTPGSMLHARFTMNYTGALVTRGQAEGGSADIDAAVSSAAAVLEGLSVKNSETAGYLVNLAEAVAARFQLGDDPADKDRTISLYREAMQSPTALPTVRLKAAQRLGSFAERTRDWTDAVDGFRVGIELMPLVLRRNLRDSDKEYWLSEYAGLATRAAACCLNADLPELALELWEQGHGYLSAQVLEAKDDLSALRQAHPDLATDFVHLRNRLLRGDTGDIFAHVTRAYQTEVQSFDDLMREIRLRPGFARFMRPAECAELQKAASEGPLVILNVAGVRSDALIVTQGQVAVVNLPDSSTFLTWFTHLRSQVSLTIRDDLSDDCWTSAQGEIGAVLEQLYDSVAKPILDRVGAITSRADEASVPRIWWVLPGPLSLLPIHAAGRYVTQGHETQESVHRRVVSSYVPNIRGLLWARRPNDSQLRPAVGNEELLMVAMPETLGMSDLPGAADEAAVLEGLFGSSCRILSGGAATHEAVIQAMPGVQFFHFAGHATYDALDPGANILALHDYEQHPLRLSDIQKIDLVRAEHAFLSACATGLPAGTAFSEDLQIASAFLLAGFRHVIAARWPIEDESPVELTGRIYATLLEVGSCHSAQALHQAVEGLRASGAALSVWCPYVHTGA